jgi:hypothetical protein
MYASGQGRWLSPDPVRACPLHPQNFDRYAYVGNSPTNRTDPHGDAVYPGFDYPYIDYGYGYYPPGYGYDEFDYLINFGVVPDYPPYGCDPILGCGYGAPYGSYAFAFAYYRPWIALLNLTCTCTGAGGEEVAGQCAFACKCQDQYNEYPLAFQFFTWGKLFGACGFITHCPHEIKTKQTVLAIGNIGLKIPFTSTITSCIP